MMQEQEVDMDAAHTELHALRDELVESNRKSTERQQMMIAQVCAR